MMNNNQAVVEDNHDESNWVVVVAENDDGMVLLVLLVRLHTHLVAVVRNMTADVVVEARRRRVALVVGTLRLFLPCGGGRSESGGCMGTPFFI